MRVFVVAVILLAGCSGPEEAERPTSPIHSEAPLDIDYEPMDPKEGTLSASGTYHITCGPVGGYGSFLPDHSVWSFAAATNATTMQIHADWTPTPTAQTVWIDVQYEGETLTTIGGEPGFVADVGIGDLPLTSRDVALTVATPQCGAGPVTVAHYDGLEVDVRVEFA